MQGVDSGGPGSNPGSEILSDAQFARVAKLAMERYGLDLPHRKRHMVTNRLFKLRRELGLEDLETLIRAMESSNSHTEHLQLFDVLSTNLTHFFREKEHLDLLKSDLQSNRDWAKLRIWSAGCSKGCEPYSIVMTLAEAFPDLARRDFKLLATDFSVSVLQTAKQGIYPPDMTTELDRSFLDKYFDKRGRDHIVKASLKAPITFALLNLIEPWQMRGPFDAIFCRNVMIFFDKPTREAITRRYAKLLKPGGLLFLGSSESLTGNHSDLLRVAPSSYRKTA